MKNRFLFSTLLVLFITVFTACKNDDDSTNSTTKTYPKTFGIFTVVDANTITMDGEIGHNSKKNFDKLIAEYSEINQINIVEILGSNNDEVNLQLSKTVYQNNINTHLNDNGLIASGGVDFFLSGHKRTKGTNTKIGVHSWGGEDDNGNEVTATDFPEGHEYHLPYIEYYKSVGFSQEEAEAFYYFTINAASFDSIHWMTDAEIEQYKLLKE
ncbi:hypothetical protein [Aureivirga sp. CE67]|uniref:hypothetical protein n=1 Tax=Aureivirga sp. CE67 TaxID=1788983 RepID=UPI0018C98797|nr:hypothetical protein [Aureivirga sp. CE67]